MLKERQPNDGTIGEEVAAESLEDFRSLSHRLTGDATAIFRHGLEHLIDHRQRYAWSDLCELYRRLDKLLRADGSRLEELGKNPERLPISGAVGKALSVVASPRLLYTLGNRFGLQRTFSHVEVSEQVLEAGRIRIDIRFPEHYEPSPECFRFTAGMLEGLPRLLSMGPAEVEWSTTPHTATYFVKPPTSRTLWSRCRRLSRTIFATRRTLEELSDQQRALNIAHQELKAAYGQVSDALEARQNFLRVISHELRTPLNGIVGTSSLLKVERDPEVAELLFDGLQQSAGRLSKLVDEMLDFVVMNGDEAKVAPTNVDFASDLRAFVRTHGEDALRKELSIDLRIADDFPKEVRLDGLRLLRAIGQLIDNAIKFTESGGVTISLGFDANEEGAGDIEVAVIDTGPGIRAHEKSRIFSVFAQGDDSSTRAIGGTGLGLALAHRSVALLDGEIHVESKLGVGSRFTIRVPAKAIAVQHLPTVLASMSKGRILVVDDDRLNRTLLKRMIVKRGFTVDLAEDGVEAVAKVQQNNYDLVFMDCEMPNMDGWEASRRIREGGRFPPIVAATAYVTPTDRQRCHQAGMDDFLAKPLSVEMVNKQLQRWVASGTETSERDAGGGDLEHFQIEPVHRVNDVSTQA